MSYDETIDDETIDDDTVDDDNVVSLVEVRHQRETEREAELRVQSVMGMLRRAARWLCSVWPRVLEYHELISIGYIAVRQIAPRFDKERGVPFKDYAYPRIRGSMLSALRKETAVGIAMSQAGYQALGSLEDDADVLYDSEERHRQRLDEFCDAVLAALYCGVVSESSYVSSVARDLGLEAEGFSPPQVILSDAMGMLPEQQALIIRRHWLDGVLLQDLAKELRLTVPTIRRRHKKAYEALCRILKRLIDEYQRL